MKVIVAFASRSSHTSSHSTGTLQSASEYVRLACCRISDQNTKIKTIHCYFGYVGKNGLDRDKSNADRPVRNYFKHKLELYWLGQVTSSGNVEIFIMAWICVCRK